MNATFPPARVVAYHEACHCAAMLIQGVPVAAARIDQPRSHGETLAGAVTVDWNDADPDKDTLRKILLAILCGALTEGANLGPEHWPIDPDQWPVEAQKDGEQAAFLSAQLGLDAVGFGWVAFQAKSLSRQRNFRWLVSALSAALQEKELLVRPELEAIAGRILGGRS
jgi:hypothetical protein